MSMTPSNSNGRSKIPTYLEVACNPDINRRSDKGKDRLISLLHAHWLSGQFIFRIRGAFRCRLPF